MSREGGIDAVRVWKRFRTDRRRRLLRDELERVRRRLSGRDAAWRWALRDVEVRIEPGEAVGLIGPNGSGKSTLLKLVNRVMYPYAGRLDVAGRVGALIEVRAGLHPELTGRENVQLYGSILGLPRGLVAQRFDDVVAFAGLEAAIDRQLKFYSSGMQMRLGFAVAAYLDPAILLVDEVLAVGDATFQTRCLEKMRDALAAGTTLVFVSHDLPAVEATCTRAVMLDAGVVTADGPVHDVMARYRSSIEDDAERPRTRSGTLWVADARAAQPDGALPATHAPLELGATLVSEEGRPVTAYFGVTEGTANPVFVVSHGAYLEAGTSEVRCRLDDLPLARGRYFVWLAVHDGRQRELVPWQPVSRFDVFGPDLELPPRAVVRLAPVHVEAAFEVEHRPDAQP